MSEDAVDARPDRPAKDPGADRLDGEETPAETDELRAGRASGLATISDVAAYAGVSTSTVSRFLRGEWVRKGEAIAEAVALFGYRPNAAARGLRSRVSHAVAVILHDITNPYLAEVVRGVQSVATEHLYLAEGKLAPEEAVLELSSRVDGFICASVTDETDVLNVLKQSKKPAVLLEFEPRERGHGLDTVVVDDVGGARQGIDYLLALGHERIGIIAGPSTTSPGRDRLRGAELAMQAAGRSLDDKYLEVSDFSWEGGYQATARLMGRDPAPTAIFAVNNLMSLGCLHCLHELGAGIPRDVSFIGFDPLVSCEIFNPPPTTIDRPQSEQGALAMRLLKSRLEGRVTGQARRIVLETHLVIRQSCAAPS
jgi:DNA-binding LacI/PurR family transcriptional regulator